MTWKSQLTGGCLLLNENSVESLFVLLSCSCLKVENMSCFIWSLNTGLTVDPLIHRRKASGPSLAKLYYNRTALHLVYKFLQQKLFDKSFIGFFLFRQ